MARDYTQVLARVEAMYPQSAGGQNYDETLRSMLSGFATDVLEEINHLHRWTHDYRVYTIQTDLNQQTYQLPASVISGTGVHLAIKSAHYLDNNMHPTYLDKFDYDELLRMYNIGVTVPSMNLGAPIRYSLDKT